jgi:hypothetical protein
VTYDQFVLFVMKDCRCCPECQNMPCDGVLAGGLCDRRCWCSDRTDSDDPSEDDHDSEEF